MTPDHYLWRGMIDAIEDIFPTAEHDFGHRPEKIEDDARKLASLLEDGAECSHLRLWDNDRRLVISRRLARLPSASAASAAMVRAGWPVSVRASGGTAVAHSAGVLNISLYIVSRVQISLSSGYERLCAIIVEAARLNGIDLSVGFHAASYCAGTHDIGWQGRKLAGTAGLARQKVNLYGGLFHASLSVCDDWRTGLDAVCKFERSLGMPAAYETANHTSLCDAVADQSAGALQA